MNDMAVHIGYAAGDHGGLTGVDAGHLNRQLQRTLHNHHGRYATAGPAARADLTDGPRRRSDQATRPSVLRQ